VNNSTDLLSSEGDARESLILSDPAEFTDWGNIFKF